MSTISKLTELRNKIINRSTRLSNILEDTDFTKDGKEIISNDSESLDSIPLFEMKEGGDYSPTNPFLYPATGTTIGTDGKRILGAEISNSIVPAVFPEGKDRFTNMTDNYAIDTLYEKLVIRHNLDFKNEISFRGRTLACIGNRIVQKKTIENDEIVNIDITGNLPVDNLLEDGIRLGETDIYYVAITIGKDYIARYYISYDAITWKEISQVSYASCINFDISGLDVTTEDIQSAIKGCASYSQIYIDKHGRIYFNNFTNAIRITTIDKELNLYYKDIKFEYGTGTLFDIYDYDESDPPSTIFDFYETDNAVFIFDSDFPKDKSIGIRIGADVGFRDSIVAYEGVATPVNGSITIDLGCIPELVSLTYVDENEEIIGIDNISYKNKYSTTDEIDRVLTKVIKSSNVKEVRYKILGKAISANLSKVAFGKVPEFVTELIEFDTTTGTKLEFEVNYGAVYNWYKYSVDLEVLNAKKTATIRALSEKVNSDVNINRYDIQKNLIDSYIKENHISSNNVEEVQKTFNHSMISTIEFFNNEYYALVRFGNMYDEVYKTPNLIDWTKVIFSSDTDADAEAGNMNTEFCVLTMKVMNNELFIIRNLIINSQTNTLPYLLVYHKGINSGWSTEKIYVDTSVWNDDPENPKSVTTNCIVNDMIYHDNKYYFAGRIISILDYTKANDEFASISKVGIKIHDIGESKEYYDTAVAVPFLFVTNTNFSNTKFSLLDYSTIGLIGASMHKYATCLTSADAMHYTISGYLPSTTINSITNLWADGVSNRVYFAGNVTIPYEVSALNGAFSNIGFYHYNSDRLNAETVPCIIFGNVIFNGNNINIDVYREIKSNVDFLKGDKSTSIDLETSYNGNPGTLTINVYEGENTLLYDDINNQDGYVVRLNKSFGTTTKTYGYNWSNEAPSLQYNEKLGVFTNNTGCVLYTNTDYSGNYRLMAIGSSDVGEITNLQSSINLYVIEDSTNTEISLKNPTHIGTIVTNRIAAYNDPAYREIKNTPIAFAKSGDNQTDKVDGIIVNTTDGIYYIGIDTNDNGYPTTLHEAVQLISITELVTPYTSTGNIICNIFIPKHNQTNFFASVIFSDGKMVVKAIANPAYGNRDYTYNESDKHSLLIHDIDNIVNTNQIVLDKKDGFPVILRQDKLSIYKVSFPLSDITMVDSIDELTTETLEMSLNNLSYMNTNFIDKIKTRYASDLTSAANNSVPEDRQLIVTLLGADFDSSNNIAIYVSSAINKSYKEGMVPVSKLDGYSQYKIKIDPINNINTVIDGQDVGVFKPYSSTYGVTPYYLINENLLIRVYKNNVSIVYNGVDPFNNRYVQGTAEHIMYSEPIIDKNFDCMLLPFSTQTLYDESGSSHYGGIVIADIDKVKVCDTKRKLSNEFTGSQNQYKMINVGSDLYLGEISFNVVPEHMNTKDLGCATKVYFSVYALNRNSNKFIKYASTVLYDNDFYTLGMDGLEAPITADANSIKITFANAANGKIKFILTGNSYEAIATYTISTDRLVVDSEYNARDEWTTADELLNGMAISNDVIPIDIDNEYGYIVNTMNHPKTIENNDDITIKYDLILGEELSDEKFIKRTSEPNIDLSDVEISNGQYIRCEAFNPYGSSISNSVKIKK